MKDNIKEKAILLIFLLIALFVSRFCVLFINVDEVYHSEGLLRGWRAKELLDGAGWSSIFNNPYFTAEGGSVVIGYMAALFFAIFGDSFFSFTVVPILFSLLILASFYLFLTRHFSRTAAIVFSFLFIFCPRDYCIFSLHGMGYHFESVLFSVLGLFCFFEIFFNKYNYMAYIKNTAHSNIKKVYFLFIVFGLISGFGIYFFCTYSIMLLVIVLFWFFFDRWFFLKRYFYYYLLGFIIGLLPWLIYNMTHNFEGLIIQRQWTLYEVLFSRKIPQIFQAFRYIATKKLIEGLGAPFYLTILLSFCLIVFLNLNSLRQNLKNLFFSQDKYLYTIKELILIFYVIAFLFTWSVLHMPSVHKDAPWLSELRGRLFHFYPFLFALVGLFFNRFLLFVKETKYFLRKFLTMMLVIWIVGIGFLNCSQATTYYVSEPRIDPLGRKGYSARLSQEDIRNGASFLETDMFTVIRIATTYDEKLRLFYYDHLYYYSLYPDSRFLQELEQFDETRKPYYYFTVGLNTGDVTEGYNLSNLNSLIIQKVPVRYRHYVYEGIAASLMGRRYKEVIENMDFINKVPEKYRHYFWYKLGTIIGERFDEQRREEKLQYAIKTFSPGAEDYIYRGLIWGLIDEGSLEDPQRDNIKEEHLPYFFRTIARNVFGDLPSEDEISHWLKEIGVDKKNEKYFYYGIIEAFFQNITIYDKEEVKRKIKDVMKMQVDDRVVLSTGLGLSLGRFTFGYIYSFNGIIDTFLDSEQLSHFYHGYGLSLKDRYGEDLDIITELIEFNIPERFKKICHKVVRNKYYLI